MKPAPLATQTLIEEPPRPAVGLTFTDEDLEDEPSNKQSPEEFASEMLDLEMQAEARDISIEVIRKLMAFYAQAIDYYVEHQSEKYKYFKKKMANLMIQPQVIEAMEVEHHKRNFNEKNKDLLSSGGRADDATTATLTRPDCRKVDLAMRRQEFEMARTLNNIDKFDKLKEIVKNHEVNTTRNHVIVQSNLKQQLENLNSKLQLRKQMSRAGNDSMYSGMTEKDDFVASDEPVLKFNSGMKRSGSHKVMATKQDPNLFDTRK